MQSSSGPLVEGLLKSLEEAQYQEIIKLKKLFDDPDIFDTNTQLSEIYRKIKGLESKWGNDLTEKNKLLLMHLLNRHNQYKQTKEQVVPQYVKELKDAFGFGNNPFHTFTYKTVNNLDSVTVKVIYKRAKSYEAKGAFRQSSEDITKEKTARIYSYETDAPVPHKDDSVTIDPAVPYKDKSDTIDSAEQKRIEKKLDQIADLLKDAKLDYEKANQLIKDIEQNHAASMSFDNRFKLMELKYQSKQVEKAMQERFDKLDKAIQAQQQAVITHVTTKTQNILNGIKVSEDAAIKERDSLKNKIIGLGTQLTTISSEQTKSFIDLKRGVTDIKTNLISLQKEEEKHTNLLSQLDNKSKELQSTMKTTILNLKDIQEKQIIHTNMLKGLENSEAALAKDLNAANKNHQKVTEKIDKQTMLLHDLGEKQTQLSTSMNTSLAQQELTRKELAQNTQLLIGLNKTANDLTVKINEGNKELIEIGNKQLLHNRALIELDKKASDIQGGINITNNEILKVRDEQKLHTDALNELNKNEKAIIASVDQAKLVLTDVHKQQSSLNKNVDALTEKATTIQHGVDAANNELRTVVKEQLHQREELTKLNKTATEINDGMIETKTRIKEIQSEQKEQTKKIDDIKREEMEIKDIVIKTGSSVDKIENEQKECNVKLRDIKQQQNRLQDFASHHREEYQSELDNILQNHQAFLTNIEESIATKKGDIHTLHTANINEIRGLSKDLFIKSENKTAILTGCYKKLQEIYQQLLNDFNRKQDMRNQFLDQVKSEYNAYLDTFKNENSLDANLNVLKDCMLNLDDIYSRNNGDDQNDNERLQQFFAHIKSCTSELNLENVNSIKRTIDKIKEIGKYTLCKNTSEMLGVVSQQMIDQIRRCEAIYERDKDKNTKSAVGALTEGIDLIYALARKSNMISIDLGSTCRNLIKSQEELIFKQQAVQIMDSLQTRFRSEQDNIHHDMNEIEAKNEYYHAEQLNERAKLTRENQQFDLSNRLFDEAKKAYQQALQKYNQAKKYKNDNGNIIEMINSISITIANITKLQAVTNTSTYSIISVSNGTIFSQSNPVMTNTSIIQKLQDFDQKNSGHTI